MHRSQEQQHYFNTPFQLSLPPTHLQSEVLSDRPESADSYEFSVEDGDVILLVRISFYYGEMEGSNLCPHICFKIVPTFFDDD